MRGGCREAFAAHRGMCAACRPAHSGVAIGRNAHAGNTPPNHAVTEVAGHIGRRAVEVRIWQPVTDTPTGVIKQALLYSIFSAACLVAARLHYGAHSRHLVPGLLFVSITAGLEAVEYAWIAFSFLLPSDGLHPIIWLKNYITSFRIFIFFGFFLGARYGEMEIAEVTSIRRAFAFAAQGWNAWFEFVPPFVEQHAGRFLAWLWPKR